MSRSGTPQRATRKRSGRCVMAAPTRSPPFEPPSAASLSGPREPLLHELLGDGEVVVEDVLLRVAHPLPVPLLAVLAAAAEVGDHPDAAALEPRDRSTTRTTASARPGSRRSRRASRACCRSSSRSFGVHDEEGHLRPVLARREELLDGVLRRVDGDLELVEGRRRPALDARLEDLGRVRERLERVERDVVVDLAAQDRRRPERRERDLANELPVLVAELEVTHDVLQVPERQAMADDGDGLERRVRPLGDDLLPLVARRVRRVDPEDAVLRARPRWSRRRSGRRRRSTS